MHRSERRSSRNHHRGGHLCEALLPTRRALVPCEATHFTTIIFLGGPDRLIA
jgi:hypothetical protein